MKFVNFLNNFFFLSFSRQYFRSFGPIPSDNVSTTISTVIDCNC